MQQMVVKIKDANGHVWTESWTVDEDLSSMSKEDIEKNARETVDSFNEHLKPGESRRELVEVVEVLQGECDESGIEEESDEDLEEDYEEDFDEEEED